MDSSKKTAPNRALNPCAAVDILTILLTMPNTRWLLLTDYASKYRVSVSTLRRRIKANQQAHRFESGRYFLPDEPGSALPPTASRSTLLDAGAGAISQSGTSQIESRQAMVDGVTGDSATSVAASVVADEPLLTATSKLLNELKQAYTLILQEKEGQILYLKEEIADLKTLVRALEGDNARLRPLLNERPIGNA